MSSTRGDLLDLLADEPATGPELAETLGISRTAVWKHIQRLQEAGFEIDTKSDGYHICSVPEYGEFAVDYHLEAPYHIEFSSVVGSTNDRARELAAEGRSDTVVLADRQAGGRGRLDRTWESPSGGIWLSILFSPPMQPAQIPRLTLAGAVAIADTAREYGIDAGIKWPNDVVVGDQEAKLAGILTEMEAEADRVSWVIVGMGINANVDADELPERATSFKTQVGTVDRARVAAAIVEKFHSLTSNDASILDAWRELNVTLGRQVRVSTQDETIVGEAIDITPPGSLCIETGDDRRTVYAGDCDHLRPV